MKLLGHHVSRPVVALAVLDGALFLSAVHGLSFLSKCSNCYVGAVVNLKIYESILLTAAFLLVTASLGLYNRDAIQDFRTFLKRFVLLWQILFIPTVAVLAFTKAAAGLPFGWYMGILSVLISLFMLVLFALRVLLVWRLDTSFIKKRIVVYGEGHLAEAVLNFINGPGRSHLRHVQTIGKTQAKSRTTVGNVALMAEPEAPVSPLLLLAESLQTDVIVVAVEDKRGLPVSELLECKLKGIDVIDSLTFWEREAGQIDFAHTGAGWLAFAGGFMLDQPSRVFKRVIDFVVSLSFLIAVLPLTLVVALAIKLESRGPIFYRQERVGLNGAVFKVWKFRSMRTDAERDGVAVWATTVDSRVTRVGKFIRMVRIDEIPQIINVLSGDMSFVGPRPERPVFVEQLRKEIPHYDLRHKVKPGITGWAQVNYPYGASIEDAKQKLSYDLYYLKNNDIVLDLAILAQTVRVILFADGAR